MSRFHTNMFVFQVRFHRLVGGGKMREDEVLRFFYAPLLLVLAITERNIESNK